MEALFTSSLARSMRQFQAAGAHADEVSPTLPPERLVALKALLELVELAGRPLLAASNRHELVAVVDECLEAYDGAAARALRRQLQKHGRALAELMEQAVDWPDYGGFPSAAAHSMKEADQIGRYIERLHESWQDKLQVAGIAVDETAEPPSIVNPAVPVEILRSLHRQQAGVAANLALLHVLAEPSEVFPEWLVTELAALRLEGIRESLRFIASVPGVHVPSAVVPEPDRLDLDAVIRRALARDQSIQRMLDEAVASGQAVYPPLESGDEYESDSET